MKKVRITKEQLESIVESTLNVENTEVVTEEVLNETFDMGLIAELFKTIASGDMALAIKYVAQFDGLQEFLGYLGGLGVSGMMFAYIKSKMDSYFKENPESLPKK